MKWQDVPKEFRGWYIFAALLGLLFVGALIWVISEFLTKNT